MKLKSAIARSIEEYYKGNMPTESVGEEFKYTLDYFENLEKTQAKDAEKGADDEEDP